MIKVTNDYGMFSLMEQNRDVDLGNRKTKNLAESMIEYGWLDAFPLMAQKKGRKLVVIDGQHRLQISREYGIPVKYVVESQDVDVAKLNDTSKSWAPLDFAKKYSKAGNEHYSELLDFYYKYSIPITVCAAILGNSSSVGGTLQKRFYQGTYTIKSRKAAYGVAECYTSLIQISPKLKKNSSIKALWACYQVQYFDPSRLIEAASKSASSIKSMPDTDGYLDLFEELYNKGKHNKHPLKFDAKQAMKERSGKG